MSVTVIVVLVLCELVVRVSAPALPDPSPWPTPESRLKAGQMAEMGCVDLVALGTSVTEAALDPTIMEISAYNAALPFGTVNSVSYWAEHFVLPEVCPDVVVVGIATWTPGFGTHSGADRLLVGLEGVAGFNNPQGWFDRLVDRSELFRRRAQLKVLAEQWTAAYRPEGAGIISEYGNQLGYRGMRLDGLPDPDPAVSASPIDEDQIEELVAVIRASGAVPVFVEEPARCSPFGSCPPDQVRDAMLDQYVALAARLGVPTLDIWDEYEPALYADTSHLNERGATMFTLVLQDELRGLGLLP